MASYFTGYHSPAELHATAAASAAATAGRARAVAIDRLLTVALIGSLLALGMVWIHLSPFAAI